MTTYIAQRYANQSQRFIQQAHYELEQKGDRLQASEKGSASVSQAVKSIAAVRGWRHNSHSRRRTIVDLIADEFDRPELLYLQSLADQLHDNFYEDRMYPGQVRVRLDQISTLLSVLEKVRQLGYDPAFAPSPEQQLIIDRLRLTEEEIEESEAIDYPPPLPPFDPETG